MKVLRTYKFRLYPNYEQEILINKTFGCTRLVYNLSLDKRKKDNKLTEYDLAKALPSLKKEYPFLKEVDSFALRNVIADLEVAFKKHMSEHAGYPKFKKKYDKESYRTNLIKGSYKDREYANIKLDLNKRVITLPKLKEVKIRGYRNLKYLNERIINVTVKKEVNRYYALVLIEEELVLPINKEEKVVGIDLGVKSIVTTSEGEVYGNPRYLEKYENKIKRLQKSLARKEKGSKNYIKALLKLKEVYNKLNNARKKLVEEIVSKVTKDNDIIITEKLKVKEMLEKKGKDNKSLRKSIANATFGLILRKLEYKCKWLNKIFYQVDTYYASSQICSRCGYQNKNMKDLNKREYKCPKCGIELDRDLNASINIMFEGLCSYYRKKFNTV